MAGPNPIAALLGNETIKSILIWQVLGQLFAPILAPVTAEIQQQVFKQFPDLPLSPADAVDAAIKGHVDKAAAQAEAALSGIDADRFETLYAAAGEPPGVAELLELWRRGEIPESGSGSDAVSVDQGIQEGRTKNKWIPALKALRYQLPSPNDALSALLEGQTDEATARDLYAKWGGSPEYFKLLFDSRGSAPTPLEAAEMARRGIIPWGGRGPDVVSFEQAFLEGPWRNKWLDPYHQLSDYIPPPRTVTAMVREGALTDAEALRFFQDAGLTADLAAAYLAAAHHQKTAAERELAKADVLTLYRDGIVEPEVAVKMLEGLGYHGPDAEFLLAAQDFKAAQTIVTQAVGRLRALFVARHIDSQQAVGSLEALQVPAAQRDALLKAWELERRLTVHVLTAAEVADAVFYKLIPDKEGFSDLLAMGYGPKDAWLRIAIRMHNKLSFPMPADNTPTG